MTDATGQLPAIAGDSAAAVAMVSRERLWRRHGEASVIGTIAGGGVNRQAFSTEDNAIRARFAAWAAARGFPLFVDAIGNLFARRPGTDPAAAPVVTGSHMDTQPQGGRFDGMYGVLAGFEALEAIDDAGLRHRRPIEVVAWSNEEGGRFAPGAMGSAVYTGARRIDDVLGLRDRNGVILGDALAASLAATPEATARRLGAPIHAYLEAHIEQGPVLDAAGEVIGVVTGIQGVRWFEVTIHGETAHAGTTPVAVRRDAVQGAVRAIAALGQAFDDPDQVLRFTVGRLTVSPNTPNSVADRVCFSIDLRHPDPARLDAAATRIAAVSAAAAPPCSATVEAVLAIPPCRFPDALVDVVEAATRRLGYAWRRMPSGAFHDAGHLAAVCPTAMIFVPCVRGISHNVAEDADPDHLAAGTRVLTAALLRLADG